MLKVFKVLHLAPRASSSVARIVMMRLSCVMARTTVVTCQTNSIVKGTPPTGTRVPTLNSSGVVPPRGW